MSEILRTCLDSEPRSWGMTVAESVATFPLSLGMCKSPMSSSFESKFLRRTAGDQEISLPSNLADPDRDRT